MKRKTLPALASAAPFVIAQFILSCLVQTTGGTLCAALSYFCVVLAFVFSMTSIGDSRGLEYHLVRLGLLITLGADYCLVLANPVRQLSGVIVFCFVQMAYFAALIVTDKNKVRRTVHILLRAAVTVLIVPVALLVLGDGVDTLAIFSAIYYVNLVCNAVFAFLDFRKWGIFAFGLLTFALCDASIGFTFLANEYLGAAEGSFLYAIANSGLNLAWVFYVPSLTLIALTPHLPLAVAEN